jgi:hypothetical protein
MEWLMLAVFGLAFVVFAILRLALALDAMRKDRNSVGTKQDPSA